MPLSLAARRTATGASLRIVEEFKTTRRYRGRTLILETVFETPDGAFRLIDFMPVRQRNSHIVRIVEGIRGEVPVRMELALRFDYGRIVPWVTALKDGVRAIAGPNLAVLHCTVPTRRRGSENHCRVQNQARKTRALFPCLRQFAQGESAQDQSGCGSQGLREALEALVRTAQISAAAIVMPWRDR